MQPCNVTTLIDFGLWSITADTEADSSGSPMSTLAASCAPNPSCNPPNQRAFSERSVCPGLAEAVCNDQASTRSLTYCLLGESLFYSSKRETVSSKGSFREHKVLAVAKRFLSLFKLGGGLFTSYWSTVVKHFFKQKIYWFF